jgi:predicted dehydrogenase
VRPRRQGGREGGAGAGLGRGGDRLARGGEAADIDIVDVATPGDSHAEIAIAAARGEDGLLREAAREHGARGGVDAEGGREGGRRAHALPQLPPRARRDAREAPDRRRRAGHHHHFRGTYLQDWILDPNLPLLWRFQKDKAGSGALGDIGSHSLDLGRFLVGEIVEVAGALETFIKTRPLVDEPKKRGKVTVDDASAAVVRFANGALGTIEGTRMAAGRKNYNRFEINGSKGSIAFDLERMNELEVYLSSTGRDPRLPDRAGHGPQQPPVHPLWWPRGTSSATSTPSPTRSTTCWRRW